VTRDWDAATYDRVSGPQQWWAKRVMKRLPLEGDERVLDAGCGSGRVTQLLLERLPEGHVVAVDGSASMVELAREGLPADRATVIESDLLDLVLDEPVDAVFSNAVFHWIGDHEALFERMRDALRPGGLLVAQCGGWGNVADFHERAREISEREPFAEYLSGWVGPWNFQGPEETAERLERAGFVEVRTGLESASVVLDEPVDYIRTVCLGNHVDRLPDKLRNRYVEAVAELIGEPIELDYVRLNIDARRP
jgi:trans-aconitate 2-methyltransferase